MMTNEQDSSKRQRDHGVSLLIIAASMIFILGMAGLGIDLASLYVARSQAQRAADAAALAGAYYLANNSCTAGNGDISPDCQAMAIAQAEAIGNTNLIAGVSPQIGELSTDVTFLSTSASDPQIQVVAARDTAHGNPMPTFFIKIFGIETANVAAKAVAEAYNAAGGNTPVGASCLKPWLMPNCDWDHLQSQVGGPNNPNCLGYAQFTWATASDPGNTTIVDPGPVAQGGVQGELLSVKSSDPSKASGPSKFYPVYLPPNPTVPNLCPACALQSAGNGPANGALYRQNISCCNMTQISCGSQVIQPITGNMVGPTALGVDCLIHQAGSSGQDTFDPTTFQITAGSNNPYGLSGPISNSDSIVTIPLYDGTPLCPGGSCPSQVTVTVTGYLKLFIKDEQNGNVNAYLMDVIPCPGIGGGGGPGGNPGTIASGSSPIPVRLIHE